MIGAWAKLLWNSAVAAAVAAAAQLGVADALGITRWETSGDSTRDWTALLTWVAFSYAVAVFVGATVGRVAVRGPNRRDRIGARITAAFFAALGAGTVVGLAWLQASGAQPPTNVNPGLVVSITAGAGVVAGFLLTLLAMSARPVATGVVVSISLLWLVAIGSALAGFITHEPYPAARLGVIDAPQLAGSVWTNPRLMIGMAAIVGLIVAGVSRSRRDGRFGVALAGFGGPAIVGAAYLIAGPGPDNDRIVQAQPYLAALIAVGAGLIASVVIAMPGGRTARHPRADLNLDDLRPLAGEVVTPPGRRPSSRPTHGESPRASTFDSLFDEQRPYAAAGTGPRAAEPRGASVASSEPRADRHSESGRGGGSGWNTDTWPGGRPSEPVTSGRHTDPRATEPARPTSAGSTYRTGAYASGAEHAGAGDTGSNPVMGQPPDPHESWLRDLGTSGRHSFDDRPN